MTTTAQIKSKGCQNTGLTEDVARKLYDNLGSTVIAIVELQADNRSENRDGDEKVQLTINYIEIAAPGLAEDHVRELQRSFHYERQLADGQMQIQPDGEGIEPKVSDVIAANPGLKPHPYVTSQLAIDDSPLGPVCDICGQVEGATALHNMPATDPFATAEADDEQDESEESDEPASDLTHPDEPHTYARSVDGGECLICGNDEDDDLHDDELGPEGDDSE